MDRFKGVYFEQDFDIKAHLQANSIVQKLNTESQNADINSIDHRAHFKFEDLFDRLEKVGLLRLKVQEELSPQGNKYLEMIRDQRQQMIDEISKPQHN